MNTNCFIIMPITDLDGYDDGHFTRVYEDLFKVACDKAGYTAIRSDDVKETNFIHLDILQKLIESPMAICDLSGSNPNVMFELGLRQAFDKPTVLVQEYGTPKIFDISPLRITSYNRELKYRQVLHDQGAIATAIEATKRASEKGDNFNSIISLLSLSSTAALKDITDNDTTKMLQVIMSEMNDLRADFRESKVRRYEREPKRVLRLSEAEINMDEIKMQYNSLLDAVDNGKSPEDINMLFNNMSSNISAVLKQTLSVDDQLEMSRLRTLGIAAIMNLKK